MDPIHSISAYRSPSFPAPHSIRNCLSETSVTGNSSPSENRISLQPGTQDAGDSARALVILEGSLDVLQNQQVCFFFVAFDTNFYFSLSTAPPRDCKATNM